MLGRIDGRRYATTESPCRTAQEERSHLHAFSEAVHELDPALLRVLLRVLPRAAELRELGVLLPEHLR